MKKILLLLSLALAVVTVQAQTSYFSQTTGDNTSSFAVGSSSGYGSVRLTNGNFVAVAISDGSGLELKEFGTDGSLLSTRSNLTSMLWSQITSVNLMDGGNALLVAGLMNDGTGYTRFALARINLSTYAVNYVTRNIAGFSYTAGPDVSVTNDAVYAVFPDFSKISAAKFDFNLNPVWNRCEVPDSGDTLGGKFPSMGGSFCDSGIVITCKDDSAYGQSRMGHDGSFQGYTVYRGPGYVRIYNLTTAADGNMIISGLWSPYYASGPDSRPLIAKMTPSGDAIWVKVLDKYNSSPSLRRFVDVREAPDGKIYAFGSLNEAYNDTYFDGVCVFDGNGTLLSAKKFGEFSAVYNLYDAKVYSDGILLSGTQVNTVTGAVSNFISFTDYSFSQFCHLTGISLTSDNHDLGPKVDRSASEMTMWTPVPPNAGSYGTLNMATDAGPVSCESATAVADPSANVAGIYPNPVNAGEMVNVAFTKAGSYTLSLVDLTGKTLSVKTVSGTNASLSVGDVAPGIYMVTVRDAGAVISSQKIIVR